MARKTQNQMHAQLARYERTITAATVMTEQEKSELTEWEKIHVTGDGRFGTSDWPGWDQIVSRISH